MNGNKKLWIIISVVAIALMYVILQDKFLILSAILPIVLFMYFIYKEDTVKEPWQLLAKYFILGMIAVIPVFYIELLFTALFEHYNHPFFEAYVVAALTEESVKFLVLFLLSKRKDIDEYYDGIVFAVYVSLGFALVENCMYVLNGGHRVAIVRFIFSVPGHGLWGVIMGYFFALATFSKSNSIKYYWLSLLVPIILHGSFDFFLMYISYNPKVLPTFICLLSFLVLMFVSWKAAIRRIQIMKDADNVIKQFTEQKYNDNTAE
jgi:RsiW-degrading membrane proteinase PrsW (M82 family)